MVIEALVYAFREMGHHDIVDAESSLTTLREICSDFKVKYKDVLVIQKSENFLLKIGERQPPSAVLFRRRFLRRHQIDLRIKRHLVIVQRFLSRARQNGPGIRDEAERGIGEHVLVLVGVEEERETAVLLLNLFGVVGAVSDLENGVPVLVVVDLPGGGQEDLRDGQDLVGAFQ
nr:hypothetical protein TorRG33x02_236040 [Ipomoea batatas]